MSTIESFLANFDKEQLVIDVNNNIALFQNTGDARFFWRAFRAIHHAGEQIPANFIDKLADWGGKLLNANSPSEIASALDLSGGEKKHTGPAHSEAYRKRWRIASEVRQVQDLYGIKQAEAIRVVARNSGLSEAKVKGAYHMVFTAPLPKQKASTKRRQGATLAGALATWR